MSCPGLLTRVGPSICFLLKPGAFSFQIVLEHSFPLTYTCPAMFSYLDDVAKAISKACSIPWMKAKGFFLVMSTKSRGKRMIPWKASPDTTVMTYSPSFCPITDGSSISRIFPAMRNTIPKGKYLQRISKKNYEDAAAITVDRSLPDRPGSICYCAVQSYENKFSAHNRRLQTCTWHCH